MFPSVCLTLLSLIAVDRVACIMNYSWWTHCTSRLQGSSVQSKPPSPSGKWSWLIDSFVVTYNLIYVMNYNVYTHVITMVLFSGLCKPKGCRQLRGLKLINSHNGNIRSRYKASGYKSEALRIWPQRLNTAKPTRCCNAFPKVHSSSCKTCNCGIGCSFCRTPPR
jgi:hypothetical protein